MLFCGVAENDSFPMSFVMCIYTAFESKFAIALPVWSKTPVEACQLAKFLCGNIGLYASKQRRIVIIRWWEFVPGCWVMYPVQRLRLLFALDACSLRGTNKMVPRTHKWYKRWAGLVQRECCWAEFTDLRTSSFRTHMQSHSVIIIIECMMYSTALFLVTTELSHKPQLISPIEHPIKVLTTPLWFSL